LDEALNIHGLKRFITDWAYARQRETQPPADRKYGERVAIIGSGPCGLTAAQDLSKLGYAVTVFESQPVAGGMMRLGVPEFRLKAEVIDREVQDIVDLGVELRLNTRIADLDSLKDQGYSAVLIAVGAHQGVRLPIPGAGLRGTLVNTDFLRAVRLGAAPDFAGKRVMVLGGGNVAMDMARTAVRLGGEVHVACIESRNGMPAHPWEIAAAESEGIAMHPGVSFESIDGDDAGAVAALNCRKVARMEFEPDGRLTLETEPGTEHAIACDVVIFSVGQRPDLALIPEASGVGVTRRQTIAVDEAYASSQAGIFAAGDVVTGTSFVIDAVAAGHKSALSIHQYLRGLKMEPARKPALPVARMEPAELAAQVRSGEVRRSPRVPSPEMNIEQRIRGFEEVETGLTEEQARAEANRCLSCGICSECLSCSYECKAGAIQHDEEPRTRSVRVGAVVLAPGYQAYRAELSEEYGLGRYPNVVTSLQFERLLSASGPTRGRCCGLLTASRRATSRSCNASAREISKGTIAPQPAACTRPRKPLWRASTTLRRAPPCSSWTRARSARVTAPITGGRANATAWSTFGAGCRRSKRIRRPVRFWCGTYDGMTARPAQRLRA
jgi:NADPH-dependent glutamate synthase beta subunit-like oxidoreductase